MVVNYKINYIIKKRLLIDVLTLYNIFLLITKPFDDLHEESILANAVIRVGIVDSCFILERVAQFLDTVWTFDMFMPRKNKIPQNCSCVRTHSHNSCSC